jgi:predicted nucleic acid-binding Zn ribbon protein
MPTYVYETIPSQSGEETVQFEVQQSMKDEPLKKHPTSGVPVRRIISGGYGFVGSGKSDSGNDHSCGHGCGCG